MPYVRKMQGVPAHLENPKAVNLRKNELKILYIKREEAKGVKYKYFVNPNTGTLHKEGGCCHSKSKSNECKLYQTEDEAIANEKRYMKRCKICFKGQ